MTPLRMGLFGVLIAVGVTVVRADPPPANTAEYREELLKSKKFTEALAAYKEALAKDPKNPALLYNAGLAGHMSGNPKDAVLFWSQLKEIEPTDWQLRTKLIQAFDAAGQKKERDAERAGFIKLRRDTRDKSLKRLKFYCRDQFSVGTTKLMVFEYFELDGDRPIRLSFDVLDREEKATTGRYTLGAYKEINAVAQESKHIKPEQRLFHLDAYRQNGQAHEFFEFFVDEPDYDAVKAMVKEILEGKRKPRSKSFK